MASFKTTFVVPLPGSHQDVKMEDPSGVPKQNKDNKPEITIEMKVTNPTASNNTKSTGGPSKAHPFITGVTLAGVTVVNRLKTGTTAPVHAGPKFNNPARPLKDMPVFTGGKGVTHPTAAIPIDNTGKPLRAPPARPTPATSDGFWPEVAWHTKCSETTCCGACIKTVEIGPHFRARYERAFFATRAMMDGIEELLAANLSKEELESEMRDLHAHITAENVRLARARVDEPVVATVATINKRSKKK